MRPLVIAGARAGGKEAALVAAAMNAAGSGEPWDILGYVDDDVSLHGAELYGRRVLGAPAAIAAQLAPSRPWLACVIGSNTAREKVVAPLVALGFRPATLIHPSSSVADRCIIGEGTYVAAGAVISADACLGRWVLVNYNATIGHDAKLGDFSQAAPGARINGECVLGRSAFVGSNASLRERVELGERAVVGMGAVVLSYVAPGTTVVGVPARRIR